MPVINLNPAVDNRTVVLWNNHGALNSTTVTAVGSAAGFPAINVIDPATYNSWKANAPAGANIRFSFTEPRLVQAVGIAAHTIASSAAMCAIRSSENGTSWTVRHSFTPTTDEDILVILPPDLTYRYWDVNFSFGAPNIGVLYMGPMVTFPCTPIDNYKPTLHAKRFNKVFNSSITGQFLGNRVMGSGGATSVTFPLLSKSWVEGPLLPFSNNYNRGGTFFYAGWPGGAPRDVAYARAGSANSIVDVNYVEAGRLATVSFDMETFVP